MWTSSSSLISTRVDSTRVVSVFRYDAGKQTERWIYPDDLAAWETIFDG